MNRWLPPKRSKFLKDESRFIDRRGVPVEVMGKAPEGASESTETLQWKVEQGAAVSFVRSARKGSTGKISELRASHSHYRTTWRPGY